MQDQTQLPGQRLQAVLVALCNSHGWQTSFLSAPVASAAELAQLCTKELAASRAAGRNDVALALADAAVAGGLDHPRLLSHRERVREQQPPGGALVPTNPRSSSALTVPDSHRKRRRAFWQWLAGLVGRLKAKGQARTVAGTPEQLEALTALCQEARWTPTALAGDLASRDLTLALLNEIHSCAEADKHLLVVQLANLAATFGIQDARIVEAQRLSQAVLEAGRRSQRAIAIKLRKQGHAAASLALLDEALASSDDDPWIQHNRARALVSLGRRREAILVWGQLQAHEDPAIAALAGRMLQINTQKLLGPLRKTLQHLAAEQSWPLRHLHDQADLDPAAYTAALLREAIDAQNSQNPQLALAFLEAARSAGLLSPSLEEQRARTLESLGRLPDAVAIWEQLTQVDDAEIRQSAQEMMERFGPQAPPLLALAKADQLLQAGELEQAISTLTEALIADPDSPELQSRLKSLVAERSPSMINPDDHGAQELEAHRRELLAFDQLLNTLEKLLEQDQREA